MNLPLRAAACGLLALSLGACATTSASPVTGTPTPAEKARPSFEAACAFEPTAYQTWLLATVFVKVGAKTQATVDAAHAIATDLCANPPALNDAAGYADATRRLVAAVATVKAARDAARKGA